MAQIGERDREDASAADSSVHRRSPQRLPRVRLRLRICAERLWRRRRGGEGGAQLAPSAALRPNLVRRQRMGRGRGARRCVGRHGAASRLSPSLDDPISGDLPLISGDLSPSSREISPSLSPEARAPEARAGASPAATPEPRARRRPRMAAPAEAATGGASHAQTPTGPMLLAPAPVASPPPAPPPASPPPSWAPPPLPTAPPRKAAPVGGRDAARAISLSMGTGPRQTPRG